VGVVVDMTDTETLDKPVDEVVDKVTTGEEPKTVDTTTAVGEIAQRKPKRKLNAKENKDKKDK
jgi:hypothetical protein